MTTLPDQQQPAPANTPNRPSAPPAPPPKAEFAPGEAERIVYGSARTAAANAARPRGGKPIVFPGVGLPPTPRDERSADDWEKKAQENRAAAATLEIERRIKNSGIPTRFEHASIELEQFEFVPAAVRDQYTAVAQRVKRLLDEPGILALLGPRGPGKTYMACALVRLFITTGKPARYVDAFDYFLALRATFRDGGGTESSVEATFLEPRLLVIDEIHERGDTAWEDRMLTRLIRKRHDQQRPSVLISNQNPDAFKDRIGPSILDRMDDDAGGIVECTWPSLRGGK